MGEVKFRFPFFAKAQLAMYQAPQAQQPPIPVFSDQQCREDWPQSLGELMGVAHYFRRNPALKGIADSIYMAIQLADRAYNQGASHVPGDR